MIIDMFSHIGPKKGSFYSIESLIDVIDEAGVDQIMICSQLETIDNDYVYESYKKFPEKTLPYAVINPWEIGAEEELEKCFTEYGFYGVKFSAVRYGFSGDRAGLLDPFFEICAKHGKSVVVHCMSDLFSLPQKWGEMAKRHPTVPVLLNHMGVPLMSNEAIALAKNYSNIYLSTCGSYVPTMVEAYKVAGADNIIFSSDAPFGDIAQEIEKVMYLTDNQEDLDKMLYKNAEKVLYGGKK